MLITSGKRVTIAAINPNSSVATTSGGEGTSIVIDIALGTAGVAVLFDAGYLFRTTDGNRKRNRDGSPSSP